MSGDMATEIISADPASQGINGIEPRKSAMTSSVVPIPTEPSLDMAASQESGDQSSTPPTNSFGPAEIAKLQTALSQIGETMGGFGEMANTLKELVPKLRAGPETTEKDEKAEERPGDKTEPGDTAKKEEETDPDEETDLAFTDKVIPEVKEHSWPDFNSRYSGDDASYAVEVLVSGSLLEDEKKDWDLKVSRNTTKPTARYSYFFNRKSIHKTSSEDGSNWIQQVRINSKVVMQMLSTVSDTTIDDQPTTFMAPFRLFIHHQDQMKKALADMEASAKDERPTNGSESGRDAEDEATAAGTADGDVAGQHGQNQTVAVDTRPSNRDSIIEVTDEAIAEMRCYVNFVDTKIILPFRKFRTSSLSSSADTPTDAKFRFGDLWHLFRVGDLIYVPEPPRTSSNMAHFQSVRRVCRVHIPIVSLPLFYPEDATGDSCTCSECSETLKKRQWYVDCYRLDYDGERYRSVVDTLIIHPYKGSREVTDLPFYPIQYANDYAEKIRVAQVDGKKFVDLLDKRYAYYAGWTLIKDPVGKAIVDRSDEPIRSPEHVESEVLVDFQEAFNANPLWKPNFAQVERKKFSLATFSEPVRLRTWSDKTRTKLASSARSTVIDNDGVETLEVNALLETDPYLGHQKGNKDKAAPVPSGEDLALLPRRLFAYAVWARKFVNALIYNVHVRALRSDELEQDGVTKDAFDLLEISSRNKGLIESLVTSHFKKKAMESSGVEIDSQDLIRGKGKGIVILLHGAPGVGKTATAEAVAQRWRKPLFPITCGDLGFTPESVQKELEEIFRLAHLWDCVLLLDEADVFITQREKNDLQRNALVSVFLRTLEYYNGILFLTTNRVGNLDEAVKSRVHLNLHYHLLNEDQTVAIFKINIDRLRVIEKQSSKNKGHEELYIVEDDIIRFARDNYQRSTQRNGIGQWNGRQIRNAFLIAASLAHYEGGDQPGMQRQLRGSHFIDVQMATDMYDEFRMRTVQGTDSERAFKRAERDDTFTDGRPDRRNSAVATYRQPPQPHQPHQPQPYHSHPEAAAARSGGGSSYYPPGSMPPPPPPSNMPMGEAMYRSSSQNGRLPDGGAMAGKGPDASPRHAPLDVEARYNYANSPAPGGDYGDYGMYPNNSGYR